MIFYSNKMKHNLLDLSNYIPTINQKNNINFIKSPKTDKNIKEINYNKSKIKI